jgi:hypothetical protein
MSKQKQVQYIRWNGDVPISEMRFIDGVPARDLTKAEWDALPKEKRRECVETGLYTVIYNHQKEEVQDA